MFCSDPVPSSQSSDPWPRVLTQAPLFRQALTEFRRVTGLSVKLVRATPPCKPIGLGVQENEFCRRIAAGCGSACPMCHRVQTKLLRQAAGKLRPHQLCCPAGMMQLAVPVVVGGEHVATVLGGKVCLRRPGAAQFKQLIPLLRRWGLEGELGPLRKAYLAAPWLAPERLRNSLRLLDLLVQLAANAVARDPPRRAPFEPSLVAKTRAFVRQHLAERLMTRQMADTLHLSEGYFCRLFHRLTGLTFHAYVARVRVEAAKEALRSPENRVSEIALAVGFQSASDFSRIFKATVGMTPSAFRSQSARSARRPRHLGNRWE